MRKAVIAMSGGVDSSAAAFLIKRRGYQCAGLTMKLFDSEEDRVGINKSCCSLSDINDARDVAFRLGFPHYVLNLKEQFERDVINKFVSVYKNGGTPNPCIDCNRYLKFNILLLRAKQIDFDFLVTGHYARIEKSGGRFLLKKGIDLNKDQSYVLYAMTQLQLESTMFPLGEITKNEARSIARENGFMNCEKKESQDICFVPDGKYADFIEKHSGEKIAGGNILDTSGNIIGVHKGITRYTIGQRRGLGVSSGAPLYVTSKSPERNTVTLGSKEALYSKSFDVDGINLIACERLDGVNKFLVKTRYLQKEQPAAVVQTGGDVLHIEFDEPQCAIAKGQAAVLYDGDTVIGGGTIS